MPLRSSKKAFSLMELSIVIVIIGLLLIGVIGSKHLIKKSRIQAAQAITRSSPISAIKNNKLWLESSLDELSLGVSAEDFITSWEDNSSNNGLSISVEGVGPKYSNSINGVQAVKFDSTSFTNHLKIDNPAFLNGTDYTIFVLEKRMATNDLDGGNYLLGATDSFALGYETTSTVIQTHGEDPSGDNQAAIESVDDYSNKPRMISFTHSSVDGNKIYINGTLANEDSSDEAKAHLTGFSSVNTLKIGNNYNGEIGELAIFDRELKNSERIDIEDYLADKWNAPNNRESTSSCTGGTITSAGCITVTCTADGTGYENKTDLPYAPSGGGSFDCDSEYSGTITYTCTESGAAEIVSGSCSAIFCSASGAGYDKTGLAYVESGGGSFDCDSGYDGTINYTCTESGVATDITGSCVQNCNVDTINGTSLSGTSVSESTVVTCDETGYDDSTLGTCSGGSTISGSCGCDSGYNNNGGVCEQQCTLTTSESGLDSDVVINSGASTYDCSDYGAHVGTLTFNASCSDGSSLTVLSGTCLSSAPPSCTGGDDTDTTSVPGYKMHIFTTVGDSTLDCTGGSGLAEILVVAGGGGGSGVMGGGGGAGGVLHNNTYAMSANIHAIKIGDGGNGGKGYNSLDEGGKKGEDSVFDDSGVSTKITAIGGGGGLHYTLSLSTNSDGGSGGGTSSYITITPGSGTLGQGHDGGGGTGQDAGGGGGGAGGAGGSVDEPSKGPAGDGGAGLDYSDEFSANYGESGWFASGGGGGTWNNTIGSSPLGGGGDGTSTSVKAGNGQANTGGGGGGAGYHVAKTSLLGGNGGSGIIIVKYVFP